MTDRRRGESGRASTGGRVHFVRFDASWPKCSHRAWVGAFERGRPGSARWLGGGLSGWAATGPDTWLHTTASAPDPGRAQRMDGARGHHLAGGGTFRSSTASRSFRESEGDVARSSPSSRPSVARRHASRAHSRRNARSRQARHAPKSHSTRKPAALTWARTIDQSCRYRAGWGEEKAQGRGGRDSSICGGDPKTNSGQH